MPLLTVQGILFDLDGVLISSIPAVERVWSKWAHQHGFDVHDILRRAHGRPSIETMRELMPSEEAAQRENLVVEKGEIEDVDGVIPLPGAQQLLAALPLESWAIVTSCTRQLADARMGAAGLVSPRYMVTASDISRGKPDPEPYLRGAEKLELAVESCIVIEDVPAGIQSGKSAGARVIGVGTTASPAELRAAGADWIIPDLRSLSCRKTGAGLQLDIRE